MNVNRIKTVGDCLNAIEKARQIHKWSSIDAEQKSDAIRQLRIAGSNEVADSMMIQMKKSDGKARRARNLLDKLKNRLSELQTPAIPELERLMTR